MAGTRVKIKQSAVVGKVPSAGSLVQGELALNTADRKLYSKDGNGSIFEISGGASGGANTAAQIQKYEFIPTLGQTVFPLIYNIIYDYVNVYYNGVKLPDVDYTATSGTDVVLGVGANLITDIITIELTKSITLHGGSRIDDHEFIASAGQIVFPMSYDVIKDNLEVYVNGIKLHSIDYTATNNTSVDLTDPADVDDEVTVRHIQAIALATVVDQTSPEGSAILPAGTTAERDATPIAGYLRWNTDLNSTEVFNGSTSTWDKVGFIDSEQIEDIVGAMVDANTETNIAVTYNDTSGKLNFGVTGLAISDTTGLQTALDDKIDDSQVLTDVPVGALFTDTIYTHPAAHTISFITGLQTALDGKVDDSQVLTNVPAGALFTDTIYTHPANHAISFITGLQTALDGKVDDAQVLTNVPVGAVFTDTTYTVGDGGLTQKNFTTTLKTKLDGIADSANNYTHPGAHAISFITGLQTALDGKVDDSQVLTNVPVGALFTDTETTTSLSINANILKYTDEVGAATNIDLSLYLDDTNLARLTTGTLNGSTGIATFSRDDSSTFTVDFSALLDDTQVTVNNTLTSTSTTQALSAAQGKVLQDGKVANSRVLTDVPTGALFTDTVYTHPANHAISVITGLQTALDGKVDDSQVLTNVPTGALFTDTTYSVGDGGLTQKNFTTALNTKLDGIATSANNYTHPASHPISLITGLQTALDGKVDDAQVLTNVPTGALFTDTIYTHPATHTIGEVSGLQSALDAKTTPGYVDTAIANLVDSAPATLDTLKELATALGDDANHVTTMTTLIGTKADTGHTHSQLYHAGSSKLATTSTGINVTGNVTATAFYGDGSNLTGVSSDNWYVDALAYDAGTSTLTIGRNGGLADLTTTITAGMEHFNQSASPTSPTLGDTWYDTTDGTIYKYINDGSSSVWVDISTAGAGDALPDQTPNAGKYLTTNGTDPAWDEMGIDNVTGLQSAIDGKIDDAQVLTNVPTGALFTDTIYTHPAAHPISLITGLQTALDAKTTPGYVDTAISNLIGAAPAALDTLQELGDALGDDANYAATITSALAGKVDDAQVLTNVPTGALFTDTVYTHPANHAISVITGLQTALDNKFDKTGGTVTGNVTANIFYGDGSNLTGISTDNFYADDLTFSGGVLTVGRNGGLADLTVNLDGRYDQHYNQGTAPTSPTIGDGWYDTTDGTFYKYINDGTNNLWVDISTAGAGGGDVDWTEILNKPSLYTQTQIDTKIADVVDSAPATLDTLKELATALNDDANFATTVTTSLANKYDKTGGTITGNITATGNVTATAYYGDGSNLAGVSSNTTPQGLYEHSASINSNYTIGVGNNAMSAGPITIATGVTVTVPGTSNWTIV